MIEPEVLPDKEDVDSKVQIPRGKHSRSLLVGQQGNRPGKSSIYLYRLEHDRSDIDVHVDELCKRCGKTTLYIPYVIVADNGAQHLDLELCYYWCVSCSVGHRPVKPKIEHVYKLIMLRFPDLTRRINGQVKPMMRIY